MDRFCTLTNEHEVRLHFSAPPTQCRVHCQATDCSQEYPNTDGTLEGLNEFQYVDLNSEDISFNKQAPGGIILNAQSCVVFRVRTTHPQSMSISVTVYKHDPNAGPGDLQTVQGRTEILPSMFAQGSEGKVTLSLIINNIRQAMEVDYLIVKPIADLRNVTNTCAWDHSQENLDIGHRGMSKCRSKLVAPYVLENTLKSFNTAADCGADFVEFDVQLTKDNIPIVFHDFLCRLPTLRNHDEDSSSAYKDVSVQELTYEELFKLKAGFAVETGTTEEVLPSECSNKGSESLFPKLVDVFKLVHPSLGFNVEIKYPTRLKNGNMEDGMTSFMDMNQFLDIILHTIDEHAGSRRIVLTCFNPDVCVMLNLKQRRFPVSFLTLGEVPRYQAYLDPRTRSVPIAIKFAAAEGLLGVNPISEYILNDFSLVKQARDLGLVMMCWGSENSDHTVINTLKQNCVHAVIYDRIDEFIAKEKSRSTGSEISSP